MATFLSQGPDNQSYAGNGSPLEIHGQGGDDTITGGNAADTIDGGEGADHLKGGPGFDVLMGGPGSDRYYLDDLAQDGPFGAFQYDTIVDSQGQCEIYVRALDNPDTFGGVDGYTLPGDSATIWVGAAWITGSLPFNLTGNDSANSLFGNNYANVLTGLEGTDYLNGYGGIDTLIGGTERDTYILADLARSSPAALYRYDTVVEAPGEGDGDRIYVESLDNPDIFGTENYTLPENVEWGEVTGTRAFNLAGNESDNWLIGNNAANALDGLAGADTLNGGLGRDELTGGDGNDRYYLFDLAPDPVFGPYAYDTVNEAIGGGTDTVQITPHNNPDTPGANGYTLADTIEHGQIYSSGATTSDFVLNGNAVANKLTGDTSTDRLNGLGGNDTLVGSLEGSADFDAADTLDGGDGNDTIIGYAGDDSLVGGSGKDRLTGGSGSDTMRGGGGNDLYLNPILSGDGRDVILEDAGGGADTVQSNQTISIADTPGVEHITLTGAAAINATGNTLGNTLQGNTGANLLNGAGGADTLVGGAGNDTLAGGKGNDSLTSGTGADLFRFSDRNANTDTITDFALANDRFDLGGGTFTAIAEVNGNVKLTHTGGIIIVKDAVALGLTLTAWNALVLPSGLAADDSVFPAESRLVPHFSVYGWYLDASTQAAFALPPPDFQFM